MTERPNLFDYAKSELSQDAFLCWLIEWADIKYQKVDSVLHRTATEFLKSIGRKFDNNPLKEAVTLQVEIEQQYKYIDVLVRIKIGDQTYVLVIEDKTDSTARKGQLEQYRETIKKEYPESNLLLVYLKTGEILPEAKREAEKNEYVVYSRNDLLRVLETSAKETNDSILSDFYIRLRQINIDCNKFRTERISKWTKNWRAWEGFFGALHEEELGKTWFFVNNRSGGEYIFDLSWRGISNLNVHVGLVIVKKWDSAGDGDGRCFLAFKVGKVTKEMNRSHVRADLYNSLMRQAKESEEWRGKVKRPERFGSGNYMVFGEITDQDAWLAEFSDGKLDMAGTIKKLKKAKKLLEALSAGP
ncbi:MAG: hypothetical protein F4234_08925 [Gammaproteobacteria bacterium]|nr:hypothetical protein [Gammaproteobacteria bacterium]